MKRLIKNKQLCIIALLALALLLSVFMNLCQHYLLNPPNVHSLKGTYRVENSALPEYYAVFDARNNTYYIGNNVDCIDSGSFEAGYSFEDGEIYLLTSASGGKKPLLKRIDELYIPVSEDEIFLCTYISEVVLTF